MKKVITFAFALSLVLYLSNNVTFAQSRGTGHGPDVGSGHGPDLNHSTSEHGKSADHATHDSAQGKTDFMTRIQRNQKLTDRLTALLPEGWDLTTASMGFKNQGQFIAFLHVVHNLKLDDMQATDLRMKMTTGESLGKALHEVDPNLSTTEVNTELHTAEDQANVDIKVTK